MKKTVLSILLVLLLIVGSLPMAAAAADEDAAATGVTTFNVTDADHLRSALQTNGNITVNLKNDIEFTMPDGYQWSDFSGYQSDYATWTEIAQGNKTINLNGYRLYITDNQITKAKYKDYTYTYSGGTYHMTVLEPNGYVRKAIMFLIPFGANLVVNGEKANSEIMFDAQFPAYDQLLDYQVATQRNLFQLEGGTLTLNGGEYQAGRRKTVYVNSALMKTDDWVTVDGVLWPSTHYYGNGEYCIGGSVVVAKTGEAYINGGTLIAHGYNYPSDSNRNAVLKTGDGHIFMFDGILKGYCCADAVQSKGSGEIKIYAGEANAYAPEQCLYPYGDDALCTESNYCAVAGGAGITTYTGVTAYYSEGNTTNSWSNNIATSRKSTYQPVSRTTGKPVWEDGTSDNKTIIVGTSAKIIYDAAIPYFPTESIPGVTESCTYSFALSKLNVSGKWESVTGWVSTGTKNYITLDTSSLQNGSYRMSARMTESWSSTHSYTYTVTAATSLTFTVVRAADYVINSIDIFCPAPVGGQELNFSTAQVTGLPEYTVCDQIVWYKQNGSMAYSGTVANTGESYEVWISLKTSAGKFASRSSLESTSKINGQKAGVMSGSDAAEMTFKYTFPPAEGPTQIKTVAATLAREPAAGQTPCYSASVVSGRGYMVEDYDYSPYQDGVAWFYAGGGEMKSTATFKAGNTYTVKISLVPASDAYEFAISGLSGTLNGKTAAVEAYNPSTAKENICVSYTFTLPSDKQQINTVAISVTEPAAGQKITPTAYLPAGAHYTLDSYTSDYWDKGVCWADENGKDIPKNGGAVFEAGKKYTVTVSVVPTDESLYEFADESDLTVTINGKAARIAVYESNKVIFGLYTFTVPESAASYMLGDADCNDKVSVMDATCIQRVLAKIPVQNYNENAADADENGKVTIMDATCIQRYLAKIPTNDRIGTMV